MNTSEYDENKAKSFLNNIKYQPQNTDSVLKPFALNLNSVNLEQDLKKLIKQGIMLDENGHFEDAIVVYKTALKKDPKNPYLKFCLAASYFKIKQYYICLEYLKDVIKYSKTNKDFTINNDLLLEQLGFTYFCLEDYDQCIQVYEPLLEKGYKTGDICNHLAIIYLEKNMDIDKVLSLAVKACELDPKNALAHMFTGSLLSAKEQFDEALKYLLKAEELGYNDVVLYIELSEIYFNFDKYDEVCFYSQKAVETDENNAKVWARLGYALYYTDNDEKASCEAFEKALDLGYEDVWANAFVAEYYLQNKDDEKTAEHYVANGLSLSKNDPYCLLVQGRVLGAKGDYHKALNYLNKAYKYDNTLYEALFFKGCAYLKLNKYKKALKAFLSIPEQERTYPWTNHYLAECFFYNNNYTQAELYLKKALDSDIKDPDLCEFAAHYLYFYKKNKNLGAIYARMARKYEDRQKHQIAGMIIDIESGKKVSAFSLTDAYKKDRKKIAVKIGDSVYLVFHYIKYVFFTALIWAIYFLIQPIM